MTKRILILLITVICITAALLGCGDNNQTNQESDIEMPPLNNNQNRPAENSGDDTQPDEQPQTQSPSQTTDNTESSNSSNYLTYKIVDTGQENCFGELQQLSSFPNVNESFYGQDAQHEGYQPSYILSDDGKTVYDNITELTWQRSPNTTNNMPQYSDKLSYSDALDLPNQLNEMAYGGYTDWRLPTIKELYSLILFSGTDPSGATASNTSLLTPFIDTDYFIFSYGDEMNGERVIDSQYLSSTTYVSSSNSQMSQMQFGVNFADGRIKGYGISSNRGEKLFYVMCVRGNEDYGINNFEDNDDGTISDNATGLMWSQKDSQVYMDWEQALEWVQQQNDNNYLGYNDWRLPDAKELHSIVDYSNSPSYNGEPAIDTDYFECTPITNEAGQTDFAYYWTSTNHITVSDGRDSSIAGSAVYFSFGSALGYMRDSWIDVHGAGAQRSAPKTDDHFEKYSSISTNGILGYYFGPQGDAVRADNYVRLVRDVE